MCFFNSKKLIAISMLFGFMLSGCGGKEELDNEFTPPIIISPPEKVEEPTDVIELNEGLDDNWNNENWSNLRWA